MSKLSFRKDEQHESSAGIRNFHSERKPGVPARIAGLSRAIKILTELFKSQLSDGQRGSHLGDTNAVIDAMSPVITLQCGDDASKSHVPWSYRMSQDIYD